MLLPLWDGVYNRRTLDSADSVLWAESAGKSWPWRAPSYDSGGAPSRLSPRCVRRSEWQHSQPVNGQRHLGTVVEAAKTWWLSLLGLVVPQHRSNRGAEVVVGSAWRSSAWC